MRFWVGSLIVAGLAGSVGIAAGQDQRPTFRATVQRVAVAATVRTRQGKSVTSLTQEDFQLLDSGNRGELSVKIGDEVIFGKYGGSEVEVNGEEYKILRESDILAKVVS